MTTPNPMPRLPRTDGPALRSRQSQVRESPYKLKHGGVRAEGKTRFGIVHMSAGGSALSSLKWLASITSSYHYIIERDGLIYRAVAHELIAHHAGDSKWPGSDGGTMNDEALGVSLANMNGTDGRHEEVRPEQYLSLLWLCAFLTEQYPELGVECWIGHRDIAPSRRNDPDPLVFDLRGFREDLTEELFRRRRDGRYIIPR